MFNLVQIKLSSSINGTSERIREVGAKTNSFKKNIQEIMFPEIHRNPVLCQYKKYIDGNMIC